jgi:hypothetical protein
VGKNLKEEKIVDNRSVNPSPPLNLKPTPRRRRKTKEIVK